MACLFIPAATREITRLDCPAKAIVACDIKQYRCSDSKPPVLMQLVDLLVASEPLREISGAKRIRTADGRGEHRQMACH